MTRAEHEFRIERHQRGDTLVLKIAGIIDEYADLSPLHATSAPRLELNLRAIHRINSFGVRSWMDAIRQIPPHTALDLVECASPIIDQCNMVADFTGHGVIRSFYAPLICERCDERLSHLYDADAYRARGGPLPTPKCPTCDRPMEVDDLEEQYLLFIREACP